MRTSFLRFLPGLLVTGLCLPALAQQPATSPPADKPKVAPMPDTPWVPEYGGMGQVMRRDNTDVYIMSKPQRPYEVLGRIVANDMATYTDDTSGQVIVKSFSILEVVDGLLAQARERAIHYYFPYDALLMTDGSVGTFVRWKNKKPAEPDTSSAQK